MLTSMADEATVVDCIEKGAVNYLRKDTPIDEISRVLVELRERIGAQRACGVIHAGGPSNRALISTPSSPRSLRMKRCVALRRVFFPKTTFAV